jgi:hypothetical protein
VPYRKALYTKRPICKEKLQLERNLRFWELENNMEDQDSKNYLTELKECKLDFLEWTPDKGVKVTETSKQYAREFLNLPVELDLSKTNESCGAKKVFNEIAFMLTRCNAGEDGTIARSSINKIAEASGTTDRRVYTVLEALAAEGWVPTKKE